MFLERKLARFLDAAFRGVEEGRGERDRIKGKEKNPSRGREPDVARNTTINGCAWTSNARPREPNRESDKRVIII